MQVVLDSPMLAQKLPALLERPLKCFRVTDLCYCPVPITENHDETVRKFLLKTLDSENMTFQ